MRKGREGEEDEGWVVGGGGLVILVNSEGTHSMHGMHIIGLETSNWFPWVVSGGVSSSLHPAPVLCALQSEDHQPVDNSAVMSYHNFVLLPSTVQPPQPPQPPNPDKVSTSAGSHER